MAGETRAKTKTFKKQQKDAAEAEQKAIEE